MIGWLLYIIITTALDLYKLLIIAYVVIGWLHISSNRWTELLRRAVEPTLNPVRVFLHAHLPANWMRTFDWSPVALYLLIGLVQNLAVILVRILL